MDIQAFLDLLKSKGFHFSHHWLLKRAKELGVHMTTQRERAYLVMFCAYGNEDSHCEQCFTERWRAEAFVDSCTPRQQARLIVLYEAE